MSEKTIKDLENKVKELEESLNACILSKQAPMSEEKFITDFDKFYSNRHSGFDISLIPKEIKVKLYNWYENAILLNDIENLKEWLKRNYYLFSFGFFYLDKERFIPIYENELDIGKMKIVYALYIEKIDYHLILKDVELKEVSNG